MKAKDLRGKAPAELGEELLKLRREQFDLRMARATGPGREARPVREGAQEHRAREDGARAQVRSRRR